MKARRPPPFYKKERETSNLWVFYLRSAVWFWIQPTGGVGASTDSLWLAQTRLTPFWKTAVWRHNLFPVVCRQYPEKKKNHAGFRHALSLFTRGCFFIHTILLHFRPTSARCVFCPTARKLNWRSMVLDFHCNKWIAGGDPAKVSGALCIADVALMAAALKKNVLFIVGLRA